MSGFNPPPHNPDGRIFASYPMPAKIDLLNERPRRESLIEKELENKINSFNLPKIQISEQKQFETTANYQNQAKPISQQSEQNQNVHQYEQRIITNMAPVIKDNSQLNSYSITNTNQQQQFVDRNNNLKQQQMVHHQHLQNQNQQQQQVMQQHNLNASSSSPTNQFNQVRTTTTTITTTNNSYQQGQQQQQKLLQNQQQQRAANNAATLASELAEKEAKLMAEINSLHQRPYSPYQVPDKIDLSSEQRVIQQQYHNAPSPRPQSQASSTRSTSVAADLFDKEAKLLQEIEEMEKKPYNPQTMVVEREEWFEYPEGRPHDRHLTDSKRRVKDFCSLPSHMYADGGRHIHEENLPTTSRQSSMSPGSMHTTIIRSPKREIDNRSPLPISFDNFTTKGVRGNIASIGAIEPDRPRPPIYPIIKRTPSPSV